MRQLFIGIILSVCLFSCKKEDPCPSIDFKAPDNEVATLRTFLLNGSITANEDPRGFFYTISAPGTGKKPIPCSFIGVNYKGKLTNGTQFDSGTNVEFNLSNLILGWQFGLPLIASGGSITLYLPPSLGYGASVVGIIPANSILIFEVTLNSVI